MMILRQPRYNATRRVKTLNTADIAAYIDANRDEFMAQLFEFLRIPSISTDPVYADDVRRCANWLVDHLEDIGMQTVELHDTEGHPVVYAEWLSEKEDAPTLLLYGHYDVQPPDPLDEWETAPFDPTIRDGKIYARGATDDKGQLFAHLKALDAWLSTVGELPINFKVLLEGEEEVGSAHLPAFIAENKEKLAADAVVISDSPMFAKGVPSIVYGLRGLAYLEMTVRGASHDLHSGLFGGAVPNPINELSKIVAALHDESGRVTIPGFYDNIVPLDDEERRAFAELPFDEEEFQRESGVPKLVGEEGYTTLERIWARPTLDCNGIWGGFTGEGAKTVLPARAHAKFSCRLVANQDPDDIAKKAQDWVAELASDAVEVEVRVFHGGPPVLTDRDNPTVRAACRALTRVWDEEAVFTRGGGSIPVVATFSEVLEVPTVLMGFGLDDDRLHSPNEKFNVENFYAGIRAAAFLLEEAAR